MSMIQLDIQHNTTLDDAKESLRHSVADVKEQFGKFAKESTWNDDRTGVKLRGRGVVLDMTVDETYFRAHGDIAVLGKIVGKSVGKPLSGGLRVLLQKHFPHGHVEYP